MILVGGAKIDGNQCGLSASDRFCFVFVQLRLVNVLRAMRANEAKLRGRISLPWVRISVLRSCSLTFCALANGRKRMMVSAGGSITLLAIQFILI